MLDTVYTHPKIVLAQKTLTWVEKKKNKKAHPYPPHKLVSVVLHG